MTQSIAEMTLAAQLEQAGIQFEREYQFVSDEEALRRGWVTPVRGLPHRWRADFLVRRSDIPPTILVEVDGGGFIAGRHTRGTGFEADAEKASAAAILGYRVIRATPRQVEQGLALSWIRQALGLEVAT